MVLASELSQRKILEVSRATAQKCVVQGRYQYAAAGALYALKMAEILYGQDAPEVVAAHLLLAEIHLGMLLYAFTVHGVLLSECKNLVAVQP